MVYKKKTKKKTKLDKVTLFICFVASILSCFRLFRKDDDCFDYFFCRYDYLKITNEHNQTVAKYCGVKTGRNVYVTGRFAVISFHSDGSGAFSGYLLNFSYISGYIFLTFTYF